ncbi:MAG: ArnT family glycosyltransferase [Candidatus Hodarchaeota archaeon]
MIITLKRANTLNKRVIILIIFLVALGVRLIALKQNYVIAQDGTLYIKMAQLYSAGEYHHEIFREYPYYAVFPLFILASHKLFGDWVLAGQWVSALCGALTVIPLYFLARRIFDEKIALLTATFYIICPNLVRYSAEVLRDIPFVFFYTTALWLAYRGIKAGRLFFVGLAGLFIALSSSLRIEGLTLLAVFAIFFSWLIRRNTIPWVKGLTAFGVLLVGTLSILIFGSFFLTQKGVKIGAIHILMAKNVLSLKILQDQTIIGLEKEVENKGISQAGKDFFHLARKHRFVLYSSHIFYKTVKVSNILFILFLFGLIKRRVIGYRQDEFLLFATYVVFIPVFLLYLNVSNYLSTRHPFPLVVPSLIWSGVGFLELKEKVILWMKGRNFSLSERALRWVTTLLFLLICIPMLFMAWAPQRKDKLELKEIGLWLKQNGHAHSIIIGQLDFSRLAFYADGEFIQLPRGYYEDVMRFAREKKANLLVINEKTIDRFSPNFLNLVSPKDLQQIYIPGIKTPKYATMVFWVKELKGKGLNPR